MNADDHRWAVILPAGDGRRASSLENQSQPTLNQYCAHDGGDPLIRGAIRRAQAVVAAERTCIVVEREHRPYWWPLRSAVPASNLLVQPHHAGTAIGILFAVLQILDRDPFAQVFIVPADHYFETEAAVSFAMRRALERITRGRLELVLIAVEAEHPAADLPYVVPGARLEEDVYRVREFIDNPGAGLAQQLWEDRCFWSTFLFCAWGFSLLSLLREYLPATVDAMSTALARADDPSQGGDALAKLYMSLPTTEFARAVMQPARSMMQLIHARHCGWSPVGRPAPSTPATTAIRSSAANKCQDILVDDFRIGRAHSMRKTFVEF
jgi:mannose-1-phosphate guanylyltransferase